MINQNSTFSINQRDIAAKMIDGEVVLINLTNGIYYSLSGVGAEVWSLIEQGGTTKQLTTQLDKRYGPTIEAVIEDVEQLLEKLLSENLVNEDRPSVDDKSFSLPVKIEPYQKPKLEVYTDMGDLLALDPPMPGLSQAPWK